MRIEVGGELDKHSYVFRAVSVSFHPGRESVVVATPVQRVMEAKLRPVEI